ncbi:zinc/iron permease [Methanocaldococcus vulcanius M7]|uniref:Zinc/iron permease n=1 Tax=Methanocaldococcus vulcanius (strain ATCC 700851 / DSM 12094 / M7) TaxID=579137 RepID=C9RF18_METVM|nr:ZIP family metal transporter [Methanocaldococcus vulcanius]ACX72170.1 zinc/iron permease [Methanocaldococcus vulcanius M7]
MNQIPLFIAVLCFFVMIIGEILAYRSVPIKYKYEFEAISFGFILGVSTLILIPKAYFKMYAIYVIFGCIFVYLIEKYLSFCPMSKKYCLDCNNLELKNIKYIYPISFFIHTFIDGVVIAVSYISKIGLPLYLAILMHKFPAGFVLISPLKGVYRNPLSIGIIISLGTIFGTIFGLVVLNSIDPKILLAFSGGVFLGAFLMLVPHIYEHKKEKTLTYLLFGYSLAGLISIFS